MKTWNHSHNSVYCCDKVSPGCRWCWALTMAARMHGNPQTEHLVRDCVYKTDGGNISWSGFPMIHRERIGMERLVDMKAPKVVAVNWMGDLFHREVPSVTIQAQLAASWRCALERQKLGRPAHWFLYLTKRVERMVLEVRAAQARLGAPQDAWATHLFGASACVQSEVLIARSLIHLNSMGLKTWLSIEPLLERVDIDGMGWLKWVVAGGATAGGPAADPDHLAAVRDICKAFGIPFLLKQLGGPGKLGAGHKLDGKAHLQAPWGKVPARGMQ